jgi:hypothetical protein
MNERINTDNYEAYFLDYLEGRLPAEREEELFHFLGSHPELKEVLDEYEEVRLAPQGVVYEGKHALKRTDFSFETIDDLNAEEAMIAWYEGDLASGEKEKLDEYLGKHPEKIQVFTTYGKTYLQALQVVYEKKKDLLHRERRRMIWLPAAAAALAFLLVFSLFLRQPVEWDLSRQATVVEGKINKPVRQQTIKKNTEILPENIAETQTPGYVQDIVSAGNKHVSLGQERKKEVTPTTVFPIKERIVSSDHKETLEILPVIREVSLPVFQEKLSVKESNSSLSVTSSEEIELLAEQTGLWIRKNILKREGKEKRRTAKELFYNSLARINTATGLNINYEKVEEPDKGTEYVAVTSRFFSYIRRKEDDR